MELDAWSFPTKDLDGSPSAVRWLLASAIIAVLITPAVLRVMGALVTTPVL